ncbi:protein BIG GRAIN 1-like A [Rutidosis leptorrhynchoides]|uniref:protein BIG GRAIN 1-like A n=1 Tax=Rutidosis leptorrhynchoides TaxID=125765 RepID=UPI003A992B1C
MCNRDKSHNEDKSNRITQHQSFSSTLLDVIYRSIDESDEKFGEMKLRKPKVAKKQSGCSHGRLKSCNVVEDEEFATFRRASLVEKWMEMKGTEKVVSSRKGANSMSEFDRKLGVDNDPMFFSSGSSSSDSSFGWCSEFEAVKSAHSCFGPLTRPKQVKTCVPPRSAIKKQSEFCLSDDDQTDKTNNSGLIRSKTRALKIYANLKKVKQPISPGGRLTTFLNGLFTNGQTKKPKESSFGDESQVTERKLKSTNVSTCSSASSFSRSCLSKNPSRSRDQVSNRMQRTVRFQNHEDTRPHIDKNICNKQDLRKLPSKFACPKLEKLDFKEFPGKFEDKKFDSDEEVDDMASDSSSDLFELDHLATFKNEQYCEELPVFETTHLCTNRAIASGLIC